MNWKEKQTLVFFILFFYTNTNGVFSKSKKRVVVTQI